MHSSDPLVSLIVAAHSLARIAALESGNDAPSAQWRALGILERQGPMRLGALATAARTTQPGMTRLVGGLERAQLVHRSPDPDDSRATYVTATPDGLQALRAWREQLRDTLAPRFADLGAEDRHALERAAQILTSRTETSHPSDIGHDRTGEHA